VLWVLLSCQSAKDIVHGANFFCVHLRTLQRVFIRHFILLGLKNSNNNFDSRFRMFFVAQQNINMTLENIAIKKRFKKLTKTNISTVGSSGAAPHHFFYIFKPT
jgi:hypothetical protein